MKKGERGRGREKTAMREINRAMRQSVLGGLCFLFGFFIGLPAASAQVCPSGAQRIRGECKCPTGKTISPDGKRCVSKDTSDKFKKTNPKTSTKTPKIEGKAATDEQIPVGARVQVISLSKEDPLKSIAYQFLGRKGVVTEQLSNVGKASNGNYYSGMINFDGVQYFFHKVTVAVLDFGATPEKITAAYGEFVPGGTYLKITDLSASDPLYSSRKSLTGKTCTVDTDGLVSTGGSWYGGPVNCDNGKSYYFYQFTFDILKEASASASTCASGAFSGATLAAGTRVKILDISSLDAYYPDRSKIIGKEGYVGNDFGNSGGCWFGGAFTADDGTYYYFFQAQVQEISSGIASAPGCKATALLDKEIYHGKRVKILDVSEEDAYYAEVSKLRGLSGTVSGGLVNNGGCWFRGNFVGDNGVAYFFYKVQVEQNSSGTNGSNSSGTPGARFTGDYVNAGTKVKILDISKDDIYYADYSSLVGRSDCQAKEKLLSSGAGWFKGGISCSDGKTYYFAKVAVSVLK